ncbi:MAG: molecular chaperone HtpG [Melioribacteraceae bacterium]|nr:molecular chaperone HtpG [Melioribacteraceae bacterium]MCF8265478.1 molecular chaperone HtpG [Melioribacteraceae bacterium]MCF8412733.1 molecular chaperone HtpG [Melioribacteraceae bacterium]MCF8431103.1 molecular chaperone HtpG [Melioribacteraceae bacterium]
MGESQGTAEKFQFKAEVKQLLDILVHSLYTSREIFLRELVSNASDALDKLRFESTKGAEIANKELPSEIRITLDEKENKLIIADTGIGMSKEELINNIGTIAKSGTSEFLKKIAQNKDQATNLIGKFGVGFYSVFMVAKEVVIKTKSYQKDVPAIEWKSDGTGDYEIREIGDDVKRGTTIEIFLKEDSKEFAEKYRVESTIKKHSNFVSFPIFVGDERINTIAAIWREPKSAIKKEQYNEFYKFLSYDQEDPMDVIHKSVDAPIQFSSLMFIPKKADEFFWMDRENYGLDLYVKRVLIQHKNKELLPEYLSFVKGVVDSEDIPLNISRETLQENAVFSKIASNVTSQILSYLKDKAEKNPEEYVEFWNSHGKIFKLGYGDFTNHEKFSELLRFNSSECKDEKELTSLSQYVSRMKDEQKEIYYLSGNSRDAVLMDPHLEIFKSKGLEVLFMYDPADEFVVNSLRKYKDFDLKSVDTVDMKELEKIKDVEDAKEEKKEELSKDDENTFKALRSKIKDILGDRVTEVRESIRLKSSPSCIVAADDAMSAQMQKILKMTNQSMGMGSQKKIFEVNKDHKLIRNMLKVYKANNDDQYIADVVEQLYESALLLEGSLEDPHNLVNRINKSLEASSDWYTSINKID